MIECGCTKRGLKKCIISHSFDELREPTCSKSGALRSEPNAVGDSPLKSPSLGGAPKTCQSCVCSGKSVWHHQQPSRTNMVLPLPASEISSSFARCMTSDGIPFCCGQILYVVILLAVE